VLLQRFLYRRISIKLGISISPNTFGPGLSIAHRGTIVVNGGAQIGANCRIHTGVNIGTEAGKADAAPVIGENCYIGPGAKIFGPIQIGSNSVIGANAVVNKSFPEGGQTIAGVPAKIISSKSSKGYLVEGHIII
jgi:serine O-acetyltransferase